MDIQQVVKQSLPARRTTLDKLGPSFTRMIRISTVICYASTYIRVKGPWYSLYRAVDKHGQTIDFLLTEHRDTEAALWFLKQAIRRNGLPEIITIDGSDANEAALKRSNEEHGTAIAIRQVK